MQRASTATKPGPEEDAERFSRNAALKRSLKYEFASELPDGIWRVVRKSDRFQFLARDETSRLVDESGSPTPLGCMLDPHGLDLMSAVMRLLNHENLINFIDWIEVQTTPTPNLAGQPSRHYILWDFCTNGTLENLLWPPFKMRGKALHNDQIHRQQQQDLKWRQRSQSPHMEPTDFLPEAFCWHVLCSVLKALAWLHDGLRDEWDCNKNAWVLKRGDMDWQTVLHRNISPDNIFFCAPQTRFETYGLCKLGNFGDSFVSGVFNGILGNLVPPTKSQKVLAPQTGSSSSHEELRKLDAMQGPHNSVNQPYTVSSEYRALADVIVAMMVTPAIPAKANRHWQRFRSLDIQTWQNTVRRTTYTKVLKNFVGELVAKGNGNVDGKDPHRPVEARAGRTYDLYRKARGLYDKFRIVKDEGKDIVTTIDVQSVHQGRERRMADEYEAMEDHRADLLDYFENSNRFTEVVDPPTSLDVLLDEIEEVCGQVDKETHETHFRPGMMY